jgi:hypothetical protein
MNGRFIIPVTAGVASACNPSVGDWELTDMGGDLGASLQGCTLTGEMEIDPDGDVDSYRGV